MASSRSISWKRFSLRSLFLFVFACSLWLGYCVHLVDPYRQQALSLESLRKTRGWYDIQPAEGSGLERWLVTSMVGPDAFVRVWSVHLSDRDVSSEVLPLLPTLVGLHELRLDRAPLSDGDLAALSELDTLESLSMKFTGISDQGVDSLAKMSNLKTLHLTGTRISDATIPDLIQLQALNNLYIRWTDISESGAQQLREAMPRCSVFHQMLEGDATKTANSR